MCGACGVPSHIPLDEDGARAARARDGEIAMERGRRGQQDYRNEQYSREAGQ